MPHDEQSQPAVSILTPSCNAAPFIAETIESVQRQTFGRFEMRVVDDGSTDETAAIVARYAAADPRIHLISQANRGIAVARNAALAGARGRYVALLDSDDIWEPEYLAEQLHILHRRPEIAVLSANAVNLGGAFDGQPLLRLNPRGGIREITLLQLVHAEDSMSILSVFRREVADTLGGFDASLRRSEDYDFWLRAAAAGFRLAVNPRPLGRYRRRGDSLSADERQMLQAMQAPLRKLRASQTHRPNVVAAVDAQLARLTHRELRAQARAALVTGDMRLLASRFEALEVATGARRYRVARWLTRRTPAAVRWAYRIKQQLHARQRGARAPAVNEPSLSPVSRAGS